jgi:hypothetical protein
MQPDLLPKATTDHYDQALYLLTFYHAWHRLDEKSLAYLISPLNKKGEDISSPLGV